MLRPQTVLSLTFCYKSKSHTDQELSQHVLSCVGPSSHSATLMPTRPTLPCCAPEGGSTLPNTAAEQEWSTGAAGGIAAGRQRRQSLPVPCAADLRLDIEPQLKAALEAASRRTCDNICHGGLGPRRRLTPRWPWRSSRPRKRRGPPRSRPACWATPRRARRSCGCL